MRTRMRIRMRGRWEVRSRRKAEEEEEEDDDASGLRFARFGEGMAFEGNESVGVGIVEILLAVGRRACRRWMFRFSFFGVG
jgi:hypothetical protein